MTKAHVPPESGQRLGSTAHAPTQRAAAARQWGPRVETRLARAGTNLDPRTGAVAMPIYQTATFRHPGADDTSGWSYTRLQNPTREALEATLAGLEGGFAALAFGSGMAAVAAVLQRLRPGDHLIMTEDLFGHTWRLMDELLQHLGVTFTLVDTADTGATAQAIRRETKGLLVESPTNPLLKVADLPALAQLCRQHGLWLAVDSTLFSPLLQRPLELGADVVLHSTSKYLSGHNDVVGGAAVTRSPALADELMNLRTLVGGVPGPQDTWLTLRGVKTLALRLQRAQESTLTIARWLERHPAVAAVNYPGLPSHPHYERCRQQATGAGALLSFRLKDGSGQRAQTVLGRLQHILFAESFGGCESLITYPMATTHREIPTEMRRRLRIDESLLRLAVGIEAVDDLLADLEQALG